MVADGVWECPEASHGLISLLRIDVCFKNVSGDVFKSVDALGLF
jgi:hypothetical protein